MNASPANLRKYFSWLLALFSLVSWGCQQQVQSSGVVTNSSVEFWVEKAKYGAELFASGEYSSGATPSTKFRPVGPIYIVRTDLPEHVYWGDARNGGDWVSGKPCVTTTGTLEPDSIYYVRKGKPPIFLAKIPSSWEFTINGTWSQHAMKAILAANIFTNDEDPTEGVIVKKLMEIQKTENP